MYILSVDTSADETSSAVTYGRRILSNIIYSQIKLHEKWGGIVPSLAKRAHSQRIDSVIDKALKKANVQIKKIDVLAVTYGPGLAIALEVGINKIKELAYKFNKKIVAVNHLEGHLYSCFAQNNQGNPDFPIKFPYLGLIISGGHTEFAIFKNHNEYQLIGQTIDDAVGESLDKAARLLTGAGYPGGPIIERLAKTGNPKYHYFPRPMQKSNDLNFSYSGLKTSLVYFLKTKKNQDKLKHLNDIAASYQKAAFDCLLIKLDMAIKQTKINQILVGGGVIANQFLRRELRILLKKYQGKILFPRYMSLVGDNAAMISIAGYYKAKQNKFINIDKLDRVPRANLI